MALCYMVVNTFCRKKPHTLTITLIQTRHKSETWGIQVKKTIHGTRLDNYRVYIFKTYTLCHAGFCRLINAFSRVLKDFDNIFLSTIVTD